MGLTLQIIATGVAAGAVYGLLAICISVIYRLTGVLHLALGEMAGLAVFATLFLAYGTQVNSAEHASLVSFALAALASLLLVSSVGGLLYLLVIKPFLHGRFAFGWVGGIVAAAFSIRGVIEAVFVGDTYVLPDPIDNTALPGEGVLSLGGGASVRVRVLIVACAALALGAAATWLLERSRAGRSLRAIVQDRTAAALCGIPIEKTMTWTFAAAGLLAGAAAVLALPGTPVSVESGTVLGLKALVAAVAAGFGSPQRVFGTAVGLGVLETALVDLDVGPLELGSSGRDLIPLVVVLMLLALRRVPDDGGSSETTAT